MPWLIESETLIITIQFLPPSNSLCTDPGRVVCAKLSELLQITTWFRLYFDDIQKQNEEEVTGQMKYRSDKKSVRSDISCVGGGGGQCYSRYIKPDMW